MRGVIKRKIKVFGIHIDVSLFMEAATSKIVPSLLNFRF